MNEHSQLTLSEKGRHRREAMLVSLEEQMRAIHRRRRLRKRAMIVGAPLAAVAALAAVFAIPPHGPGQGPDSVGSDELAQRPASPAMIVEFIQTDPSIAERYRVAAQGHSIAILSDHALLDALAQLGRPAGLVQSGDHAWVTRDVADPM